MAAGVPTGAENSTPSQLSSDVGSAKVPTLYFAVSPIGISYRPLYSTCNLPRNTHTANHGGTHRRGKGADNGPG